MSKLGCIKGGTCDLFEVNFGWKSISFDKEGLIQYYQCNKCGRIYKQCLQTREKKPGGEQ